MSVKLHRCKFEWRKSGLCWKGRMRLARAFRELGDRDTRQRAADRALEVSNAVSGADPPAGSTLAVAITGVRFVATDVIVFAGVDLDLPSRPCASGFSSGRSWRRRRPESGSAGSGDG
jgi:hypothetical protein